MSYHGTIEFSNSYTSYSYYSFSTICLSAPCDSPHKSYFLTLRTMGKQNIANIFDMDNHRTKRGDIWGSG